MVATLQEAAVNTSLAAKVVTVTTSNRFMVAAAAIRDRWSQLTTRSAAIITMLVVEI